MKNIFVRSMLIVALVLFIPHAAHATALYIDEYLRGEVVSVSTEAAPTDDDFGELGEAGISQEMTIKLLDGPNAGEVVTATYYHPHATDAVKEKDNALTSGEKVVVLASEGADGTHYDVIEPYRLSRLLILFLIFFGITILVGGKRGITSIVGLAASLAVIVLWILPKIADGANPISTSFIGAVVIACVSLYLAHGFNKRTSLSLVSTLVTLSLSLIVAVFSVSFSRMLGLGSDEAYYLTTTYGGSLDMKGLLLGAIVIGALGVLDDVTTAQTATIEELHKANPKLNFKELFRAGSSVGKEHIASLVNTLVIAYVGASLPLFLLLTSNERPLWVTLNSEFISEEIVRTLAGSITLVLAVPIATWIAAASFAKNTHR